MSDVDRKSLLRAYKETPLPAGVFAVRNTVSGRLLVGVSPNVPGMLNRQQFQLRRGAHPDRELQADWKELGSDAFSFEVLDQLKPSEDPATDLTKELQVLKELWLDKLREAGATLYPWSTNA